MTKPVEPTTTTTTTTIANIIIDEEFKFLLPRLDPQSLQALEENILEHGIRDALVIWKGHDILIDGHNRYGIAQKHGLPFRTTELEFASRDEVINWIIETQIARRNLSPLQFTYFLGLQYKAVKNIRGGQRANSGRKKTDVQNENPQLTDLKESRFENQTLINSTPGRSSEVLSEHHRVSRSTVMAAEKVADGLTAIGKTSPEAKRKIIDGEVRISRKAIIELGNAPNPEVSNVAKAIDAGTYRAKPEADSKDQSKASDGAHEPAQASGKTTQALNFERAANTSITELHEQLKKATTLPAMKTVTRKHLTRLTTLLE
ncbi:MAG: hypothetical protein FWE46_04230 [Coriobacteriia bacterium]|nr:hypothetical protein [Coriobacteriia bacterium]MCL2537187.1 hypothetical protein [Coriobacteriia bacterium]